jgi:hypothetical protein
MARVLILYFASVLDWGVKKEVILTQDFLSNQYFADINEKIAEFETVNF